MITMSNLAETLLEQAIDEVRCGIDALPTVSAAAAALRIEAGELPADELDSWLLDTAPAACTCPAGLVGRGGWRSTCPEHGRSGASGGSAVSGGEGR
jgi:hypothetical protein